MLFLVPALSLGGIPPLSGFVPKFALVEAGFAGNSYTDRRRACSPPLTLFSMMKIWIGVFWSPLTEPPSGRPHVVGRLGGPPLMVVRRRR